MMYFISSLEDRDQKSIHSESTKLCFTERFTFGLVFRRNNAGRMEKLNAIDLVNEGAAELFDEISEQTSKDDMIIDTTLEISPVHITKPSSYPALFGPNAVRFPSAALNLASLVANPPVFAPWKFEELMPTADAPCTGITKTRDQSSHDMDVDMDYESYRPRTNIDWGAYDKALAEQELRWRTIIQSHPPKNNFWRLYAPAPSHRT